MDLKVYPVMYFSETSRQKPLTRCQMILSDGDSTEIH
jgi:hypothetical protein